MAETDLEYILSWRNHPDIKRFMLSQHEITLAEHRNWFHRASRDESKALLIAHQNNQALGCVVFSAVNKNSTCDWGFYSAPDNPAGTGTSICSAALDYAFYELKVHKVAGQVLDYNHASVRIHKRLGFLEEGKLREHICINGRYHNLLCFGILSDEWRPTFKPVY